MNGKKARMLRDKTGNPYQSVYEKDPRDRTRGRTIRLMPACGRAMYQQTKVTYLKDLRNATTD